MPRRRPGREVDGIVLLDKPAGITANQALQAVRRLFGACKAGHTGTLDPFATGMLPICLGEATKASAFLLAAGKTYDATLRLGVATSTGDREGEVVRQMPAPSLELDAIDGAMRRFRGPILQVPPMYSALKHGGRPLYELARAGQTVERRPRPVTIHRLELLGWRPPDLEFRVECSKGTYVRTLAEDLAGALGTCGHLGELRRLQVGPFAAGDMVAMAQLERAAAESVLDAHLLPVDAGLADWPVLRLTAEDAARFRHGNVVETAAPPGRVRVHGPSGEVLGIGEVDAGQKLHPKRVFRAGPG